MIIGVDAGALAITDERLKVGVFRVTLELLKALSTLDKVNEYRLYSFRNIPDEIMKELGPRMHNIVLWPSKGWLEFRLPMELKLRPVQVFLGLSQALPPSEEYHIGVIHDLGFFHYPENYQGSFDHLKTITGDLIRRSNSIVTVSETTAMDIRSSYHDLLLPPITVAYEGVDAQFSTTGNKFEGQRPYFLFVGSLKKGKNIPFLIRSFAAFLKTSKTPYDLYIVGGDYWLDDDITKTLKGSGVEGNIVLKGYVPDADLPLYYRGATAFVSPSLWEGFCLPVVEAFRCGCPVIGSTAGSMPEIIGDAGILVDPSKSLELVEAMQKLTNSQTRMSLIKKGTERAKEFSWQTFAKTFMDLYPKL